nr:MAG TPA: hypothetical protein [Crassvirales sp.]
MFVQYHLSQYLTCLVLELMPFVHHHLNKAKR